MLDRTSPMRAVAMNQFVEEFGKLLSVRAELTQFEQTLIEGVYEQIFFVRERKDEWDRRVRAAFYILDQGHLKSPTGIAEHFLNTANQLAATLNSAHAAKIALHEKPDDSEGRMRGTLAYYKQLVEGPYRVLLAPIAFAFARKTQSNDKDFAPQKDGKASLKVLAKIERYSIYPQNQLNVGFHSHLRNAYAHENYQILDGEQVKVWDENPRTGKTWGPEVWSLQKVEQLIGQLELTIRALTLAVAIYSINTRAFITERDIKPTIPPPPVVARDLEASIRHAAERKSFEVVEHKRDGKTIRLKLRTQLQGIDQVSDIVVGGKGWGRRFKKPVRYTEGPVIAQLLDLLREVGPLIEDYQLIAMEILSPEDVAVGAFGMQTQHIEKLIGPTDLPLPEARKLAQVDSVGEAVMIVRHEGQVYEA